MTNEKPITLELTKITDGPFRGDVIIDYRATGRINPHREERELDSVSVCYGLHSNGSWAWVAGVIGKPRGSQYRAGHVHPVVADMINEQLNEIGEYWDTDPDVPTWVRELAESNITLCSQLTTNPNSARVSPAEPPMGWTITSKTRGWILTRVAAGWRCVREGCVNCPDQWDSLMTLSTWTMTPPGAK